eukprot:TRINITY_DN1328_c0_g1_i2.p1 TRINITY_DN1328_c0_g1~~TRINITY_DN1328_c0_g1_i2.p1  ORF type:complete len:1058 (-),score=233.78 TRINITY_DN1328_c0_g1_i2:23-3073(-)
MCIRDRILTVNQLKCVEQCPTGQCAQPDFTCLVNIISNCEVCSQGGNQCNQCAENYYLEMDQLSCTKLCNEGECGSEDYFCIRSSVLNCQKCILEGKKCEQCKGGYYYDSDSNECLESCPLDKCGDFYQICISNSLVPKCRECNDDGTICELCQANYYLQLDGQCATTCSIGTCKQPNFICLENLIENCQTCNQGGYQCYQCEDDYFLYSDGSACSDSCKPTECEQPNYFCLENIIENCKKCAIGGQVCFECWPGFYYYPRDKLCYSTCPEGTLQETIDGINYCIKCGDYLPNCLKCVSSEECTLCESCLFLKSDKSECLSTCCAEEGTWPNTNAPAQCVKCSSQIEYCIQCTTNDECAQCIEEKYLSNDKKSCVDDCTLIDTNYPANNELLKVCEQCIQAIDYCEKCSSEDTCSQCSLDKYVSPTSTSCIDSCSGFTNVWIQETPPKKCVFCADSILNCNNCIFVEQVLCTACNDLYYLSSDALSCIANCEEEFGTFDSNSYPKQCVKCSSVIDYCISCTTSGCLSCSDNKIVGKYNKTCLDSCFNQEDTFLLEIDGIKHCKLCSKAMPYCTRCDSNSHCTECASTHTIKSTQDACLLSCILEEGSYLNGYYPKQCLKCSDALPNCLTCTSKLYCTLCAENYYLGKTNQECLSECDQNTEWISPNPPQCTSCMTTIFYCQKCQDQNLCLQCDSDHFLSPENTCIKSCASVQGTFTNYLEMKCQKCSDTLSYCLLCRTSEVCYLCEKNKYLHPLTNKCFDITETPSGYFANSETMMLQICISVLDNCNTCSSNTTCTSCLPSSSLFFGKCKGDCKSGLYLNQETLSCKKCEVAIPKCILCYPDGSKCIECQEGLIILNNGEYCDSVCQENEWKNQETLSCIKCSYTLTTNCLACTDSETCTECAQGFILDPLLNQCTNKCPLKYFKKEETDTFCTSCSDLYPYCISCDITVCYACESEKVMDPATKTCIDECPLLQFENQDNICEDCNDFIENCDCLLYTSPSPRDRQKSRMPSSA